MKKVFVKPEMKCHILRGGNLLILESGACLKERDPGCSKHCYYNCQAETCYDLSGGSCEGHCKTYIF